VEFSYFGGSSDEVLPDVTMRWLPTWGTTSISGIVADFQRTKAAGVNKAILSIDWLLYNNTSPVTYKGKAIAQRNVHQVLAFLHAYGLLGMVKVLYPIDEPERDSNVGEADLIACNADLIEVCALYPELAQVKLGVIYGDHEDYRALASYNGPGGGLVGVDSYGQGSDILSGIYARLEPLLAPSQAMIVVPGGASPWRQNPAPFLAWAQTHNVGLFCAFLWDDQWGGTQNLGIRSNGMHPVYAAVAAAIKAQLTA
jgi:hypothetical protein